MFKLIAIGGKLRGEEFSLSEGENILGKDPECHICVDIDGISRKHASLSVHKESVYVKDLGSRNGLFINGKSIPHGTIRAGDKIALPHLILQLVEIRENKIIIHKKVSKMKSEDSRDDEEDLFMEPMPPNILGKIVWLYKNRFMKIIHGFNKEYEWRIILAIAIVVFITAIIALTIIPVLKTSQDLLFIETKKRGVQYVNEVKRLNTLALAKGNINKIQTSFLEESSSGVESYELLDLEKRIIAPAIKRNKFTVDAYSSSAVDFFKNEDNKNKTYGLYAGEGKIIIAKALVSYNSQKGYEDVIGVITIHFSPSTLASTAKKNPSIFLEAWATSAILAIFFFGVVYFLTIRPIQYLQKQVESSLRQNKNKIENKYLFQELLPLKNSISSILQRMRDLQNVEDSSDFESIEEDSMYVAQLDEFMQGSSDSILILNSEKNVHNINSECEDILGFRASSSVGVSIEEVARDQDIAAIIISLCDLSSSDGSSQSDNYEIGGNEYTIYVTSLIGKDSFAKAFYISFLKND